MNSNTLRKISSNSSSTLSFPSLQLIRFMGTGSRGARGHGWLHKYRAGEGGRHLQGRFHNRDIQKLASINDQVFALNNSHKKRTDIPSQAYLDLAIEGGGGGGGGGGGEENSSSTQQSASHRIVIELASTALPNTCRNFTDLCQEGYQNSKVFRILPQVGLCLGDILTNNGKNGKCSPNVSESGIFPHEPTVVSHAEKGIVTMLSTGLDKNDSRFMIITADDAPHLDGRYVAFGRVKEGLETLEDIVQNTFTRRGVPSVNIEVVGCGVL